MTELTGLMFSTPPANAAVYRAAAFFLRPVANAKLAAMGANHHFSNGRQITDDVNCLHLLVLVIA